MIKVLSNNKELEKEVERLLKKKGVVINERT